MEFPYLSGRAMGLLLSGTIYIIQQVGWIVKRIKYEYIVSNCSQKQHEMVKITKSEGYVKGK
jgi:hypothetical protein